MSRVVKFLFLSLVLAASQLAMVSKYQFGWAAEISAERVTFALPQAPMTALQKKRVGDAKLVPSAGTYQGLLRIAPTSKSSPAIVVVHTCHGTAHYSHWLERLNEWGFATLSFSRCETADGEPDDIAHSTFDWKRGATVAFGALHYLASLKSVDRDRIAIMGWSRPGMVPLSVLMRWTPPHTGK